MPEPEDAVPEDAVPEGAMPDGTAPDDAAPDDAAPETAPRDTAPPAPAAAAWNDEPDEIETAPEPRPPGSRLRAAGLVSARIGTGVIVVAAVAATIAASLLPLPSIHRSALQTTITPVPTAQQLVCPGGLLRLASASGKGATTASTLGPGAVTSGSTSGSVTQKAFARSDAATNGSAAAPQLLSSVAPTSGTQTLIAGGQSESISTAEFFGLSSAACGSPSGDVWLSGGATSVGRTTLLLLANPTDVTATVSLQIFGENGAVTAPGMDGITVEAQGQRILSLAGFAPGLTSPVVHVVSSGGQIAASLEQSTVRGIEPGGIDFVGAQAQPSTTVVIPGVVLSGTSTVQSRLGQTGFDDLQTTLRIYTPGSKSGTVQVSMVAENGKSAGAAIRADIDPGAVTDLPLDQLSDGSYSIIVKASVPLVASVRVSTAGSVAVANRTDFAWLTAAPLLTLSALVAVAPAMTAVHLENPTVKSERVTLHALGGADIVATVPASSAVSVAVVPGTSYQLSGYSGLYAAVTGISDGGVTGYVVSPSERGSTPLRIYD
ncbi:MAG: hypothetical protein JWQ39_868 [Glaciihabitans sp.]|nr:hypothetical protein [Glaciihabitans sp.]